MSQSDIINSRQIQWFPGHMTKTLRLMEKEIRNVDCVLQILDARIPLSSLNPEIERILGELTGQNTAHLPEDMLHNRRLAPRIYIQKDEHFYWPGDENNDCPDDTQYCYGLRRQLGVLCDGTVIPCCLDSEGRLALGNIFHQSLDYILNTPRAQRIRRGFDCREPAEALCRRCHYASRFNIPLPQSNKK